MREESFKKNRRRENSNVLQKPPRKEVEKRRKGMMGREEGERSSIFYSIASK